MGPKTTIAATPAALPPLYAVMSRLPQPRQPAGLERRAAVAERSSREGWIGESKQASAARVDGEVR
jgi:hypothetical protein